MMYHRSNGIKYAATKSNGSPSYGPRHPRTVQEYPPRSINIVDFTCTRTKCFVLHRKVVTRRLPPRLGHAKPMLGRAPHKTQLRPFTPKLGVLDLHPVIFHMIVK